MKTLKKIFKKFAVVLCAAMCLTLAGCDSGYAKNDYNDDKKMSSSAEDKEKSGSVELTFTKGDNKFRLVGYDCKDVKISLSI